MTRQPLFGHGAAWAALGLGLPSAAIGADWGLGGMRPAMRDSSSEFRQLKFRKEYQGV